MQLYALDKRGSAIFVGSADRKKDYICMECQSIVRVRGGMHRKQHFYHLRSDRVCRQNGKGMEHIQLQTFFYQSLQGCEIEKRFPEINRIADVVWPSEKIIFEIQCSPITADEVSSRQKDYAKIGYDVIWILHDKTFNTRKMSAAEKHLSSFTYYYTNMHGNGQGRIYDQFDVLFRGQRLFKSRAFPVGFSKVIRGQQIIQGPLPERLNYRFQQAKIFFQGDLHEHLSDPRLFQQALEIEAQYKPTKLSWLQKCIMLPCRIIFRFLLERACR